MAKTLEEIIEELRRFTTSELCDGVGAGKYHTMDSAIQERVTYKKIVGPAYTVKTPIGISGLIPDGILEMKKGDVMVIAGKGYCNGSYWGDHRSICAAMKEAEGVVIDGAFRDLPQRRAGTQTGRSRRGDGTCPQKDSGGRENHSANERNRRDLTESDHGGG